MAKHALIIDDDPMSLDILSQLLELENLTYTTVQDSTRLGEVITTLSRVDVVFLDLEMPSLNGYSVFKFLKNEVGITAPIVAHTVHLSESNEVLAMGFDSFIAKPIDSDTFHDQLQQILNGGRIWITSHR
jgi:CheY-like chemotaxis protein